MHAAPLLPALTRSGALPVDFPALARVGLEDQSAGNSE